MENFKTKIIKHNKRISNDLNLKQHEKTCNCQKEKYPLDQWSSRCAPVLTSVHRNYFTVHRNFREVK